ncbi:MAG: RimK family protein, partial [Spirochaetia bacterium]|nr:RimK family protein [Spirochaetia bacterium]
MQKIIVVSNPAEWDIRGSDIVVVHPKEYLTNPEYASKKNIRVFNLSKEYRYQSRGYYVSLIAEARGHKPLPDVKNLLDFKAPLIRVVSQDLDDLIQKKLKSIKSGEFILSVYFGQNLAERYARLSQELHRVFQAPLLRARFVYSKSSQKWVLNGIKTVSFSEIPLQHIDFVKEAAKKYFYKKRYRTAKEENLKYDLAVLVDPDDLSPPSNKKSIQKFIHSGEKYGFRVEIIEPSDFNRLDAFDALLIRMTTHVQNDSYKFARRAQSDGLALVDYPEMILKCSNKVYLKELLQTGNVPIIKTMIVHKENRHLVGDELKYPCVLKLPDSAFSFGVHKAENNDELNLILCKLFQVSDLVVAQEFVYTDFDWRIGVLDNEVLYASQYYMASGHWQIYNWQAKKQDGREGIVKTFSISDVPEEVIKIALKSCELVHGSGLYGVDIKVLNGRSFVVEVNDNPSIDHGYEDVVEGDEIYHKIIRALRKRI